MDLGLSEEQEMLKNFARDFLEKECPEKLVREMEEDERGYTDALWQGMAAQGWQGLMIAEEHGGIGIHYDCPDGCQDMANELTDLVDRGVAGGLKLLMSPYPDMDSKLALTAWDFILKLDEYDEGLVKEFIDSHHSSPNSPEPLAR